MFVLIIGVVLCSLVVLVGLWGGDVIFVIDGVLVLCFDELCMWVVVVEGNFVLLCVWCEGVGEVDYMLVVCE